MRTTEVSGSVWKYSVRNCATMSPVLAGKAHECGRNLRVQLTAGADGTRALMTSVHRSPRCRGNWPARIVTAHTASQILARSPS
jgi:hypothetical protein